MYNVQPLTTRILHGVADKGTKLIQSNIWDLNQVVCALQSWNRVHFSEPDQNQNIYP